MTNNQPDQPETEDNVDVETEALNTEDQTTPEAQTSDENDLAAELASVKDQLLRSMAETENLRRRSERERQDAGKYAISKFAQNLLSVSDNLGRALNAISEEDRKADQKLDNLWVGVDATQRELQSSFDKMGIKPINPQNQPFDPNFHEVMFEVEDLNQPAGMVVQVLEVGYMIHDRLLRPARVGVTKETPGEHPAGHSVDTTA